MLAGLLLIGCSECSGLFAQAYDPNDPHNTKTPLELSDYNWENDAKKAKLKDEEIDALKKQGFVVTGKEYRQIFSPYLWGSQVFITSDTVINAFAVLLEDSVLHLERANERRLGAFLDGTWKQLADAKNHCPADKPLAAAAITRAQMVIGVALELSSGEKVKASSKLAAQIDEETQRVIVATGQSKPAWLGPPDPGFLAIDYNRFKPRGFYAGNTKLERYFRATSWLQAIPFRFDNDQELTAFAVIYEIANDYRDKAFVDTLEQMKLIARTYGILLGEPDNGDMFGSTITSFSAKIWDPGFLPEVRSNLVMDEPKDGSQINDQIALPGKDGKPERSFRILAAHRVPDALLFAKTDEIRKGTLPSGLEVAAALGSPTARAFYEAKNAELLKKIDAEKKLFEQGSLYSEFLDVMSTLLQPVDKAAPDLFRGPAWEAKSLQTFLGGWAQARHVWVLQTKENFSTMGMGMAVPSGFVEPVPDFFSKMADLSGMTLRAFGETGLYSEGNEEAVEQIRDLEEALKRYADVRKKNPQAHISPDNMTDDESKIGSGEMLISYVEGEEMFGSNAEDTLAVVPKLEKLASRLETGGAGSDAKLQMLLHNLNPSPESNWDHFTALCSKLEALSQKQLRGVPLSKDDNGFISDYGQTLAGIMFYGGNSYENPRDDAPRICDIYADPNSGQILHVGIGRPRQIYVLYPYGGKQILTHGAVFPYYEFPNGGRLTDKEWISLLSLPTAPPQPSWLGQLSVQH